VSWHRPTSGPGSWRSLGELARLLLGYEAQERVLAERAAAWEAGGEGGIGVRALFGALAEEAADRAEGWRVLASDLAQPVLEGAEAGIALQRSAASEEVDRVSTTVEARLGVVARAILPRLASAYRRHLAEACWFCEGPVMRRLETVLPVVRRGWEDAEHRLETVGAELGPPAIAVAMRAVSDLEASGSLARLLPVLGSGSTSAFSAHATRSAY